MPSIHIYSSFKIQTFAVLNLVISGIPSILKFQVGLEIEVELF